jgi:hypothetical protein
MQADQDQNNNLLALLLQDVLDVQDREYELTQFENAIRARRRIMHDRIAVNSPPSIQRVLWWLDDDGRSRRWDDFELEMQLAGDQLENICVQVIAEVAQPDPDEDLEGPGAIDGREAGAIRPPGRIHSVRQPYTITAAIRETNWFAKSMDFNDRDFRLIYRLVNVFLLINGNARTNSA